MNNKNNTEFLTELLEFLEPSQLDYSEWVAVGMALKEEGFSVNVWDDWSRKDPARYHDGDCLAKWKSFNGNSKPVTGGTIYELARSYGFVASNSNSEGYELDWNATIGGKDNEGVIIDRNWLEGKEIHEPSDTEWNPKEQLIKYLSIFDSTENVGYVTETWEKDGKHMPTKGLYDRTAGELIAKLATCNDISEVIGDYNPNAGAWIRFNPLDGAGIKNENVTEFRYALVESDSTEIEKQNAIIRQLELPVAVLVHSGGKSLHAIVKIDAANYDEYRKRVDFLYNICQKNGLKVDSQNRNPSRLSRMPGIIRNGHKQFIIDMNIGQSSWDEWREWIEGVNDDLPEPEPLTETWDNLPTLAPCLIDGILRQGHKMLVAGPSKAGKSFALIELSIAIAEGAEWLGFSCTQGKVLYINLELDRPSCLHRFKDVYTALGLKPNHISNIDIWNLRGKTIPMDKLAPKLIRRAHKKGYIAVIIDPIYKVITGDENSAEQMSYFCNQFDKICSELGTATIYCHHHSKGIQGAKRSMDRASGSGVFSRDPDALLDLIELELSDGIKKQQCNKLIERLSVDWLGRYVSGWQDKILRDDLCSEDKAMSACQSVMSPEIYKDFCTAVRTAKKADESKTAWRIEGTLREFPKFAPVNVWFDYPTHMIDDSGVLADISLENQNNSPYKKNFSSKRTPEQMKEDKQKSFDAAFEMLTTFQDKTETTIKEMAEYMGVSEDTIRRRAKENKNYYVDAGEIGVKAGKK